MLDKFKKFVLNLGAEAPVLLDLSSTESKKFINFVKVTKIGKYCKFETSFIIPEEAASKLIEAVYTPQIFEDVFQTLPTVQVNNNQLIVNLGENTSDRLNALSDLIETHLND